MMETGTSIIVDALCAIKGFGESLPFYDIKSGYIILDSMQGQSTENPFYFKNLVVIKVLL